MSTDAQINANRANAQLSSGPKTEAGKAAASHNNLHHGLAVLPDEDGLLEVAFWESAAAYTALLVALRAEHLPTTPTETIFVNRLATHEWLRRRAVHFQAGLLDPEKHEFINESQFALFLRYQTANERGFKSCLNELQKLRSEKRKSEIGFERQQLANQSETRKNSKLEMQKDLHFDKLRLAEAQVSHELARAFSAGQSVPEALALTRESATRILAQTRDKIAA